MLATTLGLGLLAAVLGSTAGPSTSAPRNDSLERQLGFSTVVVNHVNDALGTESLPIASGGVVELGMLVTATLEKLQIYDRDVLNLSSGTVTDTTIAGECRSGCPAALFDTFQASWLEAAVEAVGLSVRIPDRVLVAAHRDLPTRTLLQVAYAAAETRPIQPPELSLLVNNARGSLRARVFYLVPPEGLALRQGSAILGLTVKVAADGLVVSATDPRYAREHRVRDLGQLQTVIRELKKRYPGKETAIFVPEDGVTVGRLMRVVAQVQDSFPRLVLSLNSEVIAP